MITAEGKNEMEIDTPAQRDTNGDNGLRVQILSPFRGEADATTGIHHAAFKILSGKMSSVVKCRSEQFGDLWKLSRPTPVRREYRDLVVLRITPLEAHRTLEDEEIMIEVISPEISELDPLES